MGENEPRTYGKRGDVFNKAFTLTVQSSLRPLIDEECFEELFGDTFKDKQLGLDILKKFYGACKLSIEESFMDVCQEHQIMDQLEKLDQLVHYWKTQNLSEWVNSEENAQIPFETVLQHQIENEQSKLDTKLDEVEKEFQENKAKLEAQRNQINLLLETIKTKKNRIEKRVGATLSDVEIFEDSEAKKSVIHDI